MLKIRANENTKKQNEKFKFLISELNAKHNSDLSIDKSPTQQNGSRFLATTWQLAYSIWTDRKRAVIPISVHLLVA